MRIRTSRNGSLVGDRPLGESDSDWRVGADAAVCLRRQYDHALVEFASRRLLFFLSARRRLTAASGNLVVGLWLLRATLRRHFSTSIRLATLVAVTFGTNLFHYAVNEATFSHAFSLGSSRQALVNLCDAFWRPVRMARVAFDCARHRRRVDRAGSTHEPVIADRAVVADLIDCATFGPVERICSVISLVAVVTVAPGCLYLQMGVGLVDRERLRGAGCAFQLRVAASVRRAFRSAAGSVVLGAGALGGSRGFGRRARLGGPKSVPAR